MAFRIARGPGDHRLFPPEDRHQVLVLATQKPADLGLAPSHRSLDDLAYHILKDAHYRDMSRSTVQRTLAEAELKPHRCRYWLHSDDPDFEAKALAICRLYLDAPRLYRQGELVVCVDEKTGIQALQRLHPTKPAAPGQPELQEFEYIRRGTRCLLATLVVPTGQVIGSVTEQRGTWDFVRHLRDVVEQFPNITRFHWVVDNLNTHYTFALCQYLGKLSGVWDNRPKLRTGPQRRAFLTDPSHKHVVYYTPKHGSWLNQIEIWFSVLTRRVLRRGEVRSVDELARKILAYIAYYDKHQAHPYAWTYTGKPLASGDRLRQKRKRYQRTRLMDIGSR
jgi:transposase